MDNINALLSYYEEVDQKPAVGFADCANGTKTPSDPKKVCRFDLSSLGPCNKSNDFGYPGEKPCAILKLNRVRFAVIFWPFNQFGVSLIFINLDTGLWLDAGCY